MSTNFDKIVRSWMNNEKMSGYIKKSALAEELLNLAIAGKDKVKISSVINMIEGLPAADVAPVIYAKWKFVAGPDEDNNLQFMCDNCGAGDVHAADVTVPYCWKCGARMDGGDEE